MQAQRFTTHRPRPHTQGAVRHRHGAGSAPTVRVNAEPRLRTSDRQLSLSDLISFESAKDAAPAAPPPDAGKVDQLIDRASRVLDMANAVLKDPAAASGGRPAAAPRSYKTTQATPVPDVSEPSTTALPAWVTDNMGSASSVFSRDDTSSTSGAAEQDMNKTRQVLQNALQNSQNRKSQDGGSSTGSSSFGGGEGGPAWAQALFAGNKSNRSSAASTPAPQLKPAQAKPSAAMPSLMFAERELSLPSFLDLTSEAAVKAAATQLPPLQSVLDLTGAFKPPTRGAAMEAAPAMGQLLADGVMQLADGTKFEKLSGVDGGPNGYQKRWVTLRGLTGDGAVAWEETTWTSSDRLGLREMGAFKHGRNEEGAAWREEWNEKLYTDEQTMRLKIERTAHKWARDEAGDEWEEKWGEGYNETGGVNKYADKWAKAGNNVWHERWGEDYDGHGACQKYTDKWAETLHEGGGSEQWGDKWVETFGDGKGTKHGENWTSNSWGQRYNRHWNEEHFGNGSVRKWGDSNTGEYWDTVEQMDTYYNPIPHFGFHHAVSHSPELWKVPLPAPEEGATGGGGGGGDDDDGGLGLGISGL